MPSTSSRFANTVDVRIIQAVGEQMPRVFRGETTILEHLRPGKLLDEYYSTALGSVNTTNWVAHTVGQVANRYPQMDIIEVGKFLDEIRRPLGASPD